MKSTKLLIKPRIVVDTNVFVSAFIWGGNPGGVIDKWLNREFILLLSPFLLTETILVLERFGLQKRDLEKLKHILENNSLKFFPKRKVNLCRDKKDNQVLDLCLIGKANYLVTGDKDLLTIKKFQKTKIVKPRVLLEKV